MNDLIFRSDAINAIKARFGNVMVIEEATKALEGVPEAKLDDDWISVKKALPENDDAVLVTHSRGVSKAWWNGRIWSSAVQTRLKTVKAWKPIPEPYKGGD